MEDNSVLATAKAWQEAANTLDVPRLLELSVPEIEIVGPRGTASGHQVLRDWVGRAGLHLTTLRTFTKDRNVVIAQHGVWRSVETGELRGEADVSSYFEVENDKVARIARYDTLGEALEKAGLGASDEIL